SPFRSDRDTARELFDDGDFIEVHVDTPLDICEQRDPKGLYEKAREGKVMDFTGISSPYDPPKSPEVTHNTQKHSTAVFIEAFFKRMGRGFD
ncbi:adenylyl-sulfate kinase, partial [Chromohalobacter sp. 48-RD10]|uniref:adenylyl-sulfate kinase n=1 Tax=Chromohalobacter sp. 48-RD10 TaxID=2994063 RepID=UPI0024689B16